MSFIGLRLNDSLENWIKDHSHFETNKKKAISIIFEVSKFRMKGYFKAMSFIGLRPDHSFLLVRDRVQVRFQPL